MTRRAPGPRWGGRLVAGLALAGVLAACRSPTPQAADREVMQVLRGMRGTVPTLAGCLRVDAQDRLALAIRQRQAFRMDLDEAVALALVASRDYRREREDVYLSALDLTLARQRFRPLWAGGGGADVEVLEDGTRVDARGDVSVVRQIARGGQVALSLALDVLRHLTGTPFRTAQSVLDAELRLPLLRGAGRLVALEPLRQANRNTVYALRDFARFQQTLRVDISSRFFAALQLRDVWQNEERAWESLRLLVDEQSVRAEAGKIAEFQLDQARQDLLRADDRRQRAERRFRDALDQLKLELGLPMEATLALDDAPLRALRAAEQDDEAAVATPLPELIAAVAQGATQRVDLRNARDQEADARRRVHIARDAVRGGVDLVVGADLVTPAERPLALDEATPSGRAGLDVDLPLERTAERNAWRRAQIEARRAARAAARLDDLVELQVRASWRRVQEARRSIAIQREGARLAERRVESTALLLEQGSATIRDRLEAEDDRVQARNALTAALVDHAVAQLELARDMGTLQVDPAAPRLPTPLPPPEALPEPEEPTGPSPSSEE